MKACLSVVMIFSHFSTTSRLLIRIELVNTSSPKYLLTASKTASRLHQTLAIFTGTFVKRFNVSFQVFNRPSATLLPAISQVASDHMFIGKKCWYPCDGPGPLAVEPLALKTGDISKKYPVYKVYMGLIIKGTIPRVPPFSLWHMVGSTQCT